MIVLVGPTASGKTDLALRLARVLDGEIVSADSRQVYRRFSAGTAKPERDENGLAAGIPYHLVDCVDPTERFDAGSFLEKAQAALDGIRARGKTAIVAGGTGLYIRALLDGLTDLPRRDEAVRRKLEAQAAAAGRTALHARLRAVDPEAAASIPANNLQRVIRALEVHELTGKPISEHWKRGRRARPAAADALVLRLDWPAPELRARIAARAQEMWPRMLRETAGLLESFSGQEPAFQSLGYPEAAACIRGRISRSRG